MLHPDPVDLQDDTHTLKVQLLRARYAVRVAESLYQALKLSPHARLTDATDDDRSACLQAGEEAVMRVVDGELRDAAEYFAANAFYGSLGDLPAGTRVNKVKDFAEALRAQARFLRGMYPAAIDHYRRLVRQDKAAIRAAREQQTADPLASVHPIIAGAIRPFLVGKDGQ